MFDAFVRATGVNEIPVTQTNGFEHSFGLNSTQLQLYKCYAF